MEFWHVGGRQNATVPESAWVVIPLDVSAAELIQPQASPGTRHSCMPIWTNISFSLKLNLLQPVLSLSKLCPPQSVEVPENKHSHTIQAPAAISAAFALVAAGD